MQFAITNLQFAMRVVILHNAVPADATPEDQDTLVQVEAVAGALTRLGHEPTAIACTLDLAAMREQLLRDRPELVFYLVESLVEADSLIYLPLAVLDVLGLPYVGSRTEAMLLTTHKLLAKEQMRYAGLPTPAWQEGRHSCLPQIPPEGRHSCLPPDRQQCLPHQDAPSWIIKGVWDQGSRGMEDDSVLAGLAPAEVGERLAQRAARTGRPCFAEQYIEGREFNLALLAGEKRGQAPFAGTALRVLGTKGACPLFSPELLPPAEIEFSAYPPHKPRIVGHRAKWQSDSFEYHNTPRRFDFPPADGPLLDELRDLARQCWTLFRLRGWARVDFRVDAAGKPWILEVNANPCISPDAGFAAALQQASIPYDEAIRRILEDVA